MNDVALLNRSVRTLAWLGDAAFEREVRWRVAARGDYPVARLNAVKTDVVRAETQAALLDAIEPILTDDERSLVRRGRNCDPGSGPSRHDSRSYRKATGFETLVAGWALQPEGWSRFETVVGAHLEAAIDEGLARHAKRPRRG